MNKTTTIVNKPLQKFLKEMQKCGYNKVCINFAHADIPDSISFSFGPMYSAFALPEINVGGWPGIWSVCEKLEYSGCGNGHQHSIPMDLGCGYYKLVDKKWEKIA